MTPPTPPWVSPELGDVKATVAVLSFIFSSAAKHSVDGESLSSELQQLGLPKGMGTWAGQGLQGSRPGHVTLRCALYSLGQDPETCPLSSPTTHLLTSGDLHSAPRACSQLVSLLRGEAKPPTGAPAGLQPA